METLARIIARLVKHLLDLDYDHCRYCRSTYDGNGCCVYDCMYDYCGRCGETLTHEFHTHATRFGK